MTELGRDPALQARLRQLVVDRAPPAKRVEVSAAVELLLAAWQDVAADQSANGVPFHYAHGQPKLLHQPLDSALRALSSDHQRFTAGQSMRDVEAVSPLQIHDPAFHPLVT